MRLEARVAGHPIAVCSPRKKREAAVVSTTASLFSIFTGTSRLPAAELCSTAQRLPAILPLRVPLDNGPPPRISGDVLRASHQRDGYPTLVNRTRFRNFATGRGVE
jgi:hypothetical protein